MTEDQERAIKTNKLFKELDDLLKDSYVDSMFDFNSAVNRRLAVARTNLEASQLFYDKSQTFIPTCFK